MKQQQQDQQVASVVAALEQQVRVDPKGPTMQLLREEVDFAKRLKAAVEANPEASNLSDFEYVQFAFVNGTAGHERGRYLSQGFPPPSLPGTVPSRQHGPARNPKIRCTDQATPLVPC